jgi:hypothetical protein
MTEIIRNEDRWLRIINKEGDVIFDVFHFASKRSWGWARREINEDDVVDGIATIDADLFNVAWQTKNLQRGAKVYGYLKPEFLDWIRRR